MKKKDFELIAKIFNKNINSTHPLEVAAGAPKVAKAMSLQFADVFASKYEDFDKARFLINCNKESE
jgi:hypothetical protein